VRRGRDGFVCGIAGFQRSDVCAGKKGARDGDMYGSRRENHVASRSCTTDRGENQSKRGGGGRALKLVAVVWKNNVFDA